MKKIFVLLLTVVLAFAAGNNAYAQYVYEHNGRIVAEDDQVLSDQDVILCVGEDIYKATYAGACKQYKTGNTLITIGSIAAGVGTVGTIAGAVASKYAIDHGHVTFEEKDGRRVVTGMSNKAALAFLGLVGGAALLSAGEICLTVGIPLKVIGVKRLDWVAGEYNKTTQPVASLRFGAGQYGTGMVLSF